MKAFDIKDPAAWDHVLTGEVLEFPASRAGVRNVRVTANTTGPTSFYVADNADMEGRVLIGHAEGMFDVAYTANGDSYLQVESRAGAVVYLSGIAASHVVPASLSEKYTTVIPQGRRNTDLDRMMMMMRLNERRRDEKLAREIERLRAERPAQVETEAPAKSGKMEVIEDEDQTADEADDTALDT